MFDLESYRKLDRDSRIKSLGQQVVEFLNSALNPTLHGNLKSFVDLLTSLYKENLINDKDLIIFLIEHNLIFLLMLSRENRSFFFNNLFSELNSTSRSEILQDILPEYSINLLMDTGFCNLNKKARELILQEILLDLFKASTSLKLDIGITTALELFFELYNDLKIKAEEIIYLFSFKYNEKNLFFLSILNINHRQSVVNFFQYLLPETRLKILEANLESLYNPNITYDSDGWKIYYDSTKKHAQNLKKRHNSYVEFLLLLHFPHEYPFLDENQIVSLFTAIQKKPLLLNLIVNFDQNGASFNKHESYNLLILLSSLNQSNRVKILEHTLNFIQQDLDSYKPELQFFLNFLRALYEHDSEINDKEIVDLLTNSYTESIFFFSKAYPAIANEFKQLLAVITSEARIKFFQHELSLLLETMPDINLQKLAYLLTQEPKLTKDLLPEAHLKFFQHELKLLLKTLPNINLQKLADLLIQEPKITNDLLIFLENEPGILQANFFPSDETLQSSPYLHLCRLVILSELDSYPTNLATPVFIESFKQITNKVKPTELTYSYLLSLEEEINRIQVKTHNPDWHEKFKAFKDAYSRIILYSAMTNCGKPPTQIEYENAFSNLHAVVKQMDNLAKQDPENMTWIHCGLYAIACLTLAPIFYSCYQNLDWNKRGFGLRIFESKFTSELRNLEQIARGMEQDFHRKQPNVHASSP